MTKNRARGDKRQKLNLKFKDLPEKKKKKQNNHQNRKVN